MNEDPLEQMQSKIAYLERAVTELSDVAFRQHTEIQAIQAKLKAISDRLSGSQSDETPRAPEDEQPPHY
jgi:uncharacterized coiled-coil protein SlyX